MAKLSTVVKNKKREALVKKYEAKRKELRKKVVDPNISDEERYEAGLKLQRLPRNSCKARVRNRCQLTGRSRGFFRTFRLSRIAFRELALRGMIPGVIKASW